jgi:hypothetical protein
MTLIRHDKTRLDKARQGRDRDSDKTHEGGRETRQDKPVSVYI